MRKLMFVIAVLTLAATPAFAQTTTAAPSGNWTYAAIGVGIAVAAAAIGQSRVAAAAAEGMARNPAARPGIQLALFLGLAFIESLVLFVWVLAFLKAS